MAGSTMGSDVGKRARRIGSAIKSGSTSTLREAATKAQQIEKASIAAVAGGDMVLSGVGQKGAKVGVAVNVRPGNSPTALIRATGPLQLIERPTGAHMISSRFAGSRRARAMRAISFTGGRRESSGGFVGPVLGRRIGGGKRAVLKMPDGEYRRYARHPGTRGQEPFAKGQAKAKPVVSKTMHQRTGAIIKKAM